MIGTELSVLINASNELLKRRDNAGLRRYFEGLSLSDIKKLQEYYKREQIEPPFSPTLESVAGQKEWDFAEEFFNKFPGATKLSRKINKSDDFDHYTYMRAQGLDKIELDHSFVNLNGNLFELASGKNYLGEGGFANVKEGRRRSGEVVAIKIEGYANNADARATELGMLDELGRLKGQGIRELSEPRQFKRAEVAHKSYMAMTLIPGRDLRKVIRDQLLTPEQSVIVALNVLMATQELHNRSIIHRDIKPDNFMIDKDLNATIIDLNISRRMDPESMSFNDFLVGTPGYFAPEIRSLTGSKVNYTTQSDVWALGTSLLNAHDLNLGFLNSEAIKSMTSDVPSERPMIIKVLIELSNVAKDYPSFTDEHKERLRDLTQISFQKREISEAERDLIFENTQPRPKEVASSSRQRASSSPTSSSSSSVTASSSGLQRTRSRSFLGLFGLAKSKEPKPKPIKDPPNSSTSSKKKKHK